MLENVRGLSGAPFAGYRQPGARPPEELGYAADWQVLNACEFGVPQLRPRFILVAMRAGVYEHFAWPSAVRTPPTVGETLHELMAAGGWPGADAWAERANGIGPTLVGGSRKHGGPDLGPTRAREAWLRLGVDGKGLADAPPGPIPSPQPPAPADPADGRRDPGLPAQLAVLRPQDRGLPPDRQRLPAAGRTRGRRQHPVGHPGGPRGRDGPGAAAARGMTGPLVTSPEASPVISGEQQPLFVPAARPVPSHGDDPELDRVEAELYRCDPDGSGVAGVLRDTLDQLYDGQHTGRWNFDQLHKTEKTHMGTLVEINLHRHFGFDDGDVTDYRIAGIEVDCKYSMKLGWLGTATGSRRRAVPGADGQRRLPFVGRRADPGPRDRPARQPEPGRQTAAGRLPGGSRSGGCGPRAGQLRREPSSCSWTR